MCPVLAAAERPAARNPRTLAMHSTFTEMDREALYQELQPLVKRLIRQYGESPEMRQDLQGEVYCRFCALLEAYDPGRGVPLRPYLVRQLTASVYTFARSGWRSRQREVSMEALWGVNEARSGLDPADGWIERLTQQDMLKSLPQAVASLPKRQRQALIWRYYDEKSHAEIADLLNIEVSSARSLLRHALNGLRSRLACGQ